MGHLREYYKKSFELIKNNKKIIYSISLLYLLVLIGGIFYYYNTYRGFSTVEDKEAYYQVMKEINFKDNLFQNFWYIFSHNLIASLFRIIGGILLAIIPIFLIINGAISDSYSWVASAIDEGLTRSLLSFLPHSVFEIPAFILASSLGLMVFLSIFKKGNKIKNITQSYKDALTTFLCIILPLLFLSGIIESIIIMILWF